MIHRVKLVKGDESAILKSAPKKKVKASVMLSQEIMDMMRRVMDLPKGASSDTILQQFLNKTFEK